jgi:hypothetical protein
MISDFVLLLVPPFFACYLFHKESSDQSKESSDQSKESRENVYPIRNRKVYIFYILSTVLVYSLMGLNFLLFDGDGELPDWRNVYILLILFFFIIYLFRKWMI